MTELKIIDTIYGKLISLNKNGGIPVNLKARSTIGTVQDDPFDKWIGGLIDKTLPKNFEVVHSGSLTTPDIVIRDKEKGTIVGLEIKKLIQKPNGSDSRGLTIDYNSSLPSGSTMIKVGEETVIIPCYYLFALLNNSSTKIVTLVIVDGDFLNYDFDLHKESKYANYTEYGHGPYGEGSVRHRKMYTYPNPLNTKLKDFFLSQILVGKKAEFDKLPDAGKITEQIIRTDKFGNSFYYYLKDGRSNAPTDLGTLKTLTDIFDACKKRKPKKRTASMPVLKPLKK
ncbi:MAG TPA: hypothetical protein ENJ95_08005 [Bacteroidetes bacterium]|nr:hypothetical protein [Bacteroidota bacterium]